MKFNSCKNFIDDFSALLIPLKADTVSEHAYCQNYLQHILEHNNYYLHIYAKVLDIVLKKSGKEKSDIELLDYGTGNAVLGIFAKFCGFKKVFCLDRDAQFLSAGINLSGQLNIYPDGFIEGDMEAIPLHGANAKIDAIVGTDVIEHIYDLNTFFSRLKQVNPKLISVFTTASNPQNPFKSKHLKRLQYRDEHVGYQGDDIDSNHHASFFSLREEIINHAFPALMDTERQVLARATRGLRKEDILKTISKYLETNKLPVPFDSHNTCNPLNGSWTERLLPLKTYRYIYEHYGFQFEWHPGFYNSRGSLFKSIVNGILNMSVKQIGGKVSPFIILVGYKK